MKDPDIFIFDEATPNLDALTEKEVFSTILDIVGGRTAIFVTHLPIEALAADKVIAMRDDGVVEVGKPSELILKGGEFAKMFQEYAGVAAEMWSRQEPAAPPKPLLRPLVERGERKSLVNIKLDGATIGGCRPLLPFPVTNKRFVLLDCSSRQYMIEDYEGLDEGSRAVLEEAIKANVLVFRVKAIRSVDIKGDELVWELETDYGPRTAATRGRRNVMLLGNKLVLIDVYDDAYEIDVPSLDRRSRELLNKVI